MRHSQIDISHILQSNTLSCIVIMCMNIFTLHKNVYSFFNKKITIEKKLLKTFIDFFKFRKFLLFLKFLLEGFETQKLFKKLTSFENHLWFSLSQQRQHISEKRLQYHIASYDMLWGRFCGKSSTNKRMSPLQFTSLKQA